MNHSRFKPVCIKQWIKLWKQDLENQVQVCYVFLKIDLIIATLIERQLSYNLFRLDIEIKEAHKLPVLFLLPNMFTYRCVL